MKRSLLGLVAPGFLLVGMPFTGALSPALAGGAGSSTSSEHFWMEGSGNSTLTIIQARRDKTSSMGEGLQVGGPTGQDRLFTNYEASSKMDTLSIFQEDRQFQFGKSVFTNSFNVFAN